MSFACSFHQLRETVPKFCVRNHNGEYGNVRQKWDYYLHACSKGQTSWLQGTRAWSLYCSTSIPVLKQYCGAEIVRECVQMHSEGTIYSKCCYFRSYCMGFWVSACPLTLSHSASIWLPSYSQLQEWMLGAQSFEVASAWKLEYEWSGQKLAIATHLQLMSWKKGG